MHRLTDHFTLAEMTVSQTASRKGIKNTPGAAETEALYQLCKNVLEPVRQHFGKPVIVTSGYRSPRLNRAIGGSSTSQHCKGEAADFTVAGAPNADVLDWMHRNLNYDQLIDEFNPGGWIHVSYSPRMRNQELSARRRYGRTRYLPGLHQ